MFFCTLLYVHSSIAIILMGKRELVALLNLSSWCLVMVERLCLMVPQGCLLFVIVVFPDHAHLLFLKINRIIHTIEQWKLLVKQTVNKYWTDRLNAEASEKSTLCYLNNELLKIGQAHSLCSSLDSTVSVCHYPVNWEQEGVACDGCSLWHHRSCLSMCSYDYRDLGPIHMHKIYTCQYFASWSKHTHVSKSIFNLRSHANSVHISILKGTRTYCTAGMYNRLMAAAILFVHWSCT